MSSNGDLAELRDVLGKEILAKHDLECACIRLLDW